VSAITGGVASHLAGINLVDVDAYGDSFPAIEAIFSSKLQLANRLVLVVNGGLARLAGTERRENSRG
jgi:hypothetical protein